MTPTPPAPLWAGRSLALAGILLVAFNLRSAVASLSPILGHLESEIPLGPVLIGLLGMLPPLCYAVFGIATPVLARRLGLERSLVSALAVLVVGLAWRGLAVDATTLLLASILTFAAIGAGNVLLPPLVKRYFPDRIGVVTTAYVTAISVSTLVPPLVAVPLADAAGWRASLGVWAVFAVAGLVPWIALLVHPRRRVPEVLPEEADPGRLRQTLRSPYAWSLAVFFSVSSFSAYACFAWLPRLLIETAGVSEASAGALLALYAAMGLPAGLLVPVLAARYGRVGTLITVSVLVQLGGFAGLILAPTAATWLWVVLVGLGPLLFPLSLVLINLRTRTHEGSVALSGLVQSFGYLVAASGPLVTGLLHDATGGWTVPLAVIGGSALVAAVTGVVVARPHYLEDEPERR